MAESNQNTAKTPMAQIVRVPIPNSQGILILGIFSLVTTFCCAGIIVGGLVLGILAVTMSSRANELYQQNPQVYTEGSLKNVNAGRICGIIGIIANAVILLFGIVWLVFLGAGVTTWMENIPWEDVF